MQRLRYLGVGKETVFGTAVDPLFHLDIASAGLDSPGDQLLTYAGGLQRFTRKVCPGPYRSEGPVAFAADVSTVDLILSLLLGDRSTNSTGITPVADEQHSTGAGETSLSFLLTNPKVCFGSLTIDDGITQLAHDDGFGKIVEDASSGIEGTINYATGAVTLTGLTESEDYFCDYDYGFYVHTIGALNDDVPLSATLRLGKDAFEHIFAGSVISQFSMSVARDFLNISLDIVGGKDTKGSIVTYQNLKLIKHCPVAFHDVDFKIGDKGGALSSVAAKVNSLELVMNNNASTELGMGLNSRFPNAAFVGEFNLTGTVELRFENTDQKEDFWGGATEPSADGPVEKAAEVYMDSGNWGNCKVELPRMYYQSVAVQPSGKDKLVETLSLLIPQDETTGDNVVVTVNNLIDWLA